MEQDRFWMFFPLFLFTVTIVGLTIVPLMVMQPNLDRFQFAGQRSLIGVLFCTLCISGVIAVFYPGKCRGVFQHTPNPPAKAVTLSNHLHIEGHHPNCQNFSKNRITIGGRIFCAACSGLLVGAIIAITGAIAYFFTGLNVISGGIWLVILGEIGMGLGMIQMRVNGFVKVMLNAIFVIGSFTTLALVDALGKSIFLDLYVLGLIFFLLWFRILLSEWKNKQTCRNCRRCIQ